MGKKLDKGMKIKIIKIAIGSSLAILIGEILGLQYATSAGIVTLLTIQDTKKDTFNLAILRVISFVMTVVLTGIIGAYVKNHALAFGIFMLIMTGICYRFSWQGTISVNAVIGTHILVLNKSLSLSFAVEETLVVLIGTAIAIILNLSMPDKMKEIREDIHYIEEELRDILHSISKHLGQEKELSKDRTHLTTLIDYLDVALERAFHNVDNSMNEHAKYYIEYLTMRQYQCILLLQFYRTIIDINQMPQQATLISTFMADLAEALHEQNNVEELSMELEEVFRQVEKEPLPKSRAEFENGAYLYHVLKELEEFLRLNQEFVENLTEEQMEIYWS